MLDRVVVNSGPLVALSLAGRLDLLPALCREFPIPEAVYREVTVAGVGRPGAAGLSDAPWAVHDRYLDGAAPPPRSIGPRAGLPP